MIHFNVNGVPHKKRIRLVEIIKSMPFEMNLSKQYQLYAFYCDVTLTNRMFVIIGNIAPKSKVVCSLHITISVERVVSKATIVLFVGSIQQKLYPDVCWSKVTFSNSFM